MRTPLLLSFLALTSAAVAQTVVAPGAGPDMMIKEAYQNMKVYDTLKLEMNGTDAFGKFSLPVHVVLYYRLSVDPRTGHKTKAEVDLGVFEPGKDGPILSYRIVGDGLTLHRYDFYKREVTKTVYGYYGDREPANYLGSDAPKLFSQLAAATPGVATYVVRLLSEINPAGNDFASRLTNWTPGYAALNFDAVPMPTRQLNGEYDVDDTVTDPNTGQLFVRGKDRLVFFGFDHPEATRFAAFRMYDADPAEDVERWEVQSVNFSLRAPNRLLNLNIVPNSSAVLPGGAFAPYVGTEAAFFRLVTRGL